MYDSLQILPEISAQTDKYNNLYDQRYLSHIAKYFEKLLIYRLSTS